MKTFNSLLDLPEPTWEEVKLAQYVRPAPPPIPSQNNSALLNTFFSSIPIIADWSQTQKIADRKNGYYEQNPILGNHPNQDAVNAYFLSVLFANAIAPNILSPEKAKLLQGLITVGQTGIIGHNYGLGLNVGF